MSDDIKKNDTDQSGNDRVDTPAAKKKIVLHHPEPFHLPRVLALGGMIMGMLAIWGLLALFNEVTERLDRIENNNIATLLNIDDRAGSNYESITGKLNNAELRDSNTTKLLKDRIGSVYEDISYKIEDSSAKDAAKVESLEKRINALDEKLKSELDKRVVEINQTLTGKLKNVEEKERNKALTLDDKLVSLNSELSSQLKTISEKEGQNTQQLEKRVEILQEIAGREANANKKLEERISEVKSELSNLQNAKENETQTGKTAKNLIIGSELSRAMYLLGFLVNDESMPEDIRAKAASIRFDISSLENEISTVKK